MSKFHLWLLAIFIPSVLISSGNDPVFQNEDYLVVYHPDFETELEVLLDHRRESGLRVHKYNILDIPKESDLDQLNLRRFISEKMNELENPQYLLLAGASSHIPCYNIPSNFQRLGEYIVSYDNIYGEDIFDQDYEIDLAVGRLPSKTPDEMRVMVNKIIKFERGDYNYQNESSFLFDQDPNNDPELFHRLGESLSELFPDQNKVKILNYFDGITNKTEVIQSFLNSSLLHVYFGHGNYDQWSYYNIVDNNSIINNLNSNQPFIHFAIACSQEYNIQNHRGIQELLITKEDGGSLMNFISSGITFAGSSRGFFEDLMIDYYQNGERIAGKLLKNYLIDYNFDDSYSNAKLKCLLGDPATVIPYKVVSSIFDLDKDILNFLIYPNPANNFINLEFDDLTLSKVEIFDLNGSLVLEKINQFGKLDISNLTSGSYFIVLTDDKDNSYRSKFVKE